MNYLDNAATTLIKPEAVGREMLKAMRQCASPGRGAHRPAMLASETVFRCRQAAAELFKVPDPERVVFTMNATHALNIAIKSLAGPGTKVLISGYEHNSVTRTLHQIGADVTVADCPVFDSAAALESFRSRISGKELVICTHVSNAFGFILPVYEIAELCRERGIPFIVDASQSSGVLDVDFTRLNAAFIAMPGHKGLFGPQGTGILLCGADGKPLLSGGSGSDSIIQTMPEYLPDRLEAGTHNVCGIAGLLAGIDYVRAVGTDKILEREEALRQSARSVLESFPALEVFCGEEGSQSGVISFRCRSGSCEDLAAGLAEHGICVRSGLHCAPLAHKTVGTLHTGTVRISFSPFVTDENIRNLGRTLQELLA